MQITLPINIAEFFDPEHINHLPFLEKATELYELIKDCQKRKGWAYFKLKFISRRLEISKRYAQKLIQVLRDHSLIEVARREHNYYRTNPTIATNRGKKPASNYQKQPGPRQSPISEPVAIKDEPQIIDPAAAEIVAAFEASRAADLSAQATVEPMAEPEVQETVIEAARSVRGERQYTRPKDGTEYFNLVKARLIAWGIEAPGQLLADVVTEYWMSWV